LTGQEDEEEAAEVTSDLCTESEPPVLDLHAALPPPRDGVEPNCGITPRAASIPPATALKVPAPPFFTGVAVMAEQGMGLGGMAALALLRVPVPLVLAALLITMARGVAQDAEGVGGSGDASSRLVEEAEAEEAMVLWRLRRMLVALVAQLLLFFFEGPEMMSGRDDLPCPPVRGRVTKSPREPMVVGVVLAETSCSPKHSTCIDGVCGDPCTSPQCHTPTSRPRDQQDSNPNPHSNPHSNQSHRPRPNNQHIRQRKREPESARTRERERATEGEIGAREGGIGVRHRDCNQQGHTSTSS